MLPSFVDFDSEHKKRILAKNDLFGGGKMNQRTYAAISTAPVSAALGLVRMSGPDAINIADRIFQACDKKTLAESESHTVHYGSLRSVDEKLIDRAMVTLLRAPKTFTGEDTVEFCCHGGMITLRQLLSALLEAGAEAAEPGEFTKTAYLNGKLDLSESESIIDLITAPGRIAAEAALTASQGALSARIDEVRQILIEQLAHILAYVDYTDEGIVRLEEDELRAAINKAKEKIGKLIATYPLGRAAREGIHGVLCGRPNTGKSSLMNLLYGGERSIVTDIAGTTRDVVTEKVDVGGIPMILSDTAGLRETEDVVEQIGVNRAREEMAAADMLLCVFDCSEPLCAEDEKWVEEIKALGKPAIAICNKADRGSCVDAARFNAFSKVVTLSAKTGEGLSELLEAITEKLGLSNPPSDHVLITSTRHLSCLKRANEALSRAIQTLDDGMFSDIAEIDITDAANALGEITGKTTSEDIVTDIFARFCVGK